MAAPVIYNNDGHEWRFPILTPMDLITLGRVIYSRLDRRRIIEDMNVIGLDREEQEERLLRLEMSAGSAAAIGFGLMRLENAIEAIKMSVAKMEGEQPDIETFPPGDFTGLAMLLCNFTKQERAAGADPDEENPTKASGQ